MSRKLPLALLLACGTLLPVAAHAAEESGEEATFELKRIEAKDAGTLVRTIADIRHLRIPDEKTLVIQGTAKDVAFVKALLGMAETLDTSGAEPRSTGDGTVVALRLERAAPADVMTALRTEVKIAKVVAMEDGRMFLRDTKAQIEAALALIRELEGAGSE